MIIMNKKSIISILFAVSTTVSLWAQLFRPLGLGFDGGEWQGENSQPRMHIEDDSLYVCTNKGLYVKDLTNDDSVWQLVGFDGLPLQDFARCGKDLMALRYNQGGEFLFLSHDGGQTYEDVTPDVFCHEKYEIILNMVQHPIDPKILLVSTFYHGILRSTDFGKTWEQLTGALYGNRIASFIGFHPSRPTVIYNCGEDMIFAGHINISYDAGQTWNDHSTSYSDEKGLGFLGDNCLHRPAFHPTNPDRWIVGGEGCVFLTDDNGKTWNCQNYWHDESRSAYWYFSIFDIEHPDTVYMAGSLSGLKLMCSIDGGLSWYSSQTMTLKKEKERVNDFQQYGDRLLIYTESDVYEVSKVELISKSTNVNKTIFLGNEGKISTYDLQGRQTIEPKQGFMIKNGQKYFCF